MSKKTGITLIVIVTALVLTITLAVSYAYWTTTKKGTTRNIVTSGCFSFEISKENNEINLDNAYPIADSEVNELVPYTFTVTNTCTIYASYEVNLEMLGTSTLNSSLIAIKVNNENKKILGTLSARDTQESTSKEARLIASGGLEPNESAKYDLRVWLDEHVTLEDDAENKIFRGKVVVVGTASGETELSDEEKTITLYIDDQEVTQTTRLNVLKYDIEVPNENWTNIGASKGTTVSYNNGTILLNKIADGTKVFLNDSVNTTITNTDNTETNIVMLKDVTNDSSISIPYGKTIILDLNGKTISSNTDTIVNTGKLTITDNSLGGKVTSTGTNTKTISSKNSGTELKIENGFIQGTSDCSEWSCSPIFTSGTTVLEITPKTETILKDGNYTTGVYVESTYGIAVWVANGATATINGGYYNVIKNNETAPWQHLVCSVCDKLTINDAHTIGNGNGIRLQTSGNIDINGGYFYSELDSLITDSNTNGTVNINGGTFIGNRRGIHIPNNSNIILNINQTNKPIYISSKAKIWVPAIFIAGSGDTNIIANQANKCTNNSTDTTSGLCVYAEGINGDGTTNNNNGALQNSGDGNININGGTFFGGHQGINNSNNGTINILSAHIISKNMSILNVRSGIFNICNSKIQGSYDLVNDNVNITENGIINYSSNVIFTNGTNTPNMRGKTANIIPNYTGTCTAE